MLLAALAALAPLGGCGYVKLLRPSVRNQLNPRVVALVNEFPDVDHPNEAIIARLPGHGGLAHASVDARGVMHTVVRAPKNQLIWEPSVIAMPHGGTLEIAFTNDDQVTHGATVERTDGEQVVWLPIHTAGRVRVRLDQPGLYKYTCPVADHGWRGMLGLIVVRGDVPPAARLDRPPQRRP
ncbi:MAG TPA: MSMEG_3727 family PQQ-associated protein [Gemmatimonadaceae bacterium]